MFLSITKTKNGYQFRNGPRRMPMDEVVRRLPPEYVRTIDKDAASWMVSVMRRKGMKVVFACDDWCRRWGEMCNVSKVTLLGFNDITYTGGARVAFLDHGDKRESILYPRDVAEVIGYNRWHISATFDDAANLTVEYD